MKLFSRAVVRAAVLSGFIYLPILSCTFAQAEELLHKSAENFPFVYDASARPTSPTTTPRWTLKQLGSYGEKISILPSGALFYSPLKKPGSEPTQTRYAFSLADDSISCSQGFTVETELTMPKFGGEFHLVVSFAGETREAGIAFLRITNASTQWSTSAPSAAGEIAAANATYQTLSEEPNWKASHLFRLVKLPGRGKWLVYRDGEQIGTNLTGEIGSEDAETFLAFGKYREGTLQATVKSIRWDPTGAYAP